MFSQKFVIVLCIVGAVTAHYRNNKKSENNKSEDLRIIDSIQNEPQCLSQGGICVIAADCESDLTEERGLCPKQRSKGVECCYGQSVKETRCRKLGGECMEQGSCENNSVVFQKRATDCPEDTVCCTLVN